MTCYQHPGMSAVYRCANCGREMCAICAVRHGDRNVCRDCAEVLRRQPAPATPEAGPEPQPEVAEPGVSGPPKPALGEPSGVPVPVAPAAVAPAPKPRPPAVPGTETGGPRAKESILSAALSLVLPGAGQAYNGQVIKALILAALYIGSIALILGGAVIGAIYARAACLCCLPLFIVPLAVLVYAIYDAYVTAEKINERKEVRDWL